MVPEEMILNPKQWNLKTCSAVAHMINTGEHVHVIGSKSFECYNKKPECKKIER